MVVVASSNDGNLRAIERMDGKIGLVWFSGFDFILLDFFL